MWSHFGTALKVDVHVGQTGKTGCAVETWPSCCRRGKMCDFFHFICGASSSRPLWFCNHLFLYFFIYFCLWCVFFSLSGSAQPNHSAFVLEFNIPRSDLCLHLAAAAHISRGNTATVLFFVIEDFLAYGGWQAGGGEFAMFPICPQGAMSAFLDNTPVEGRQVASTFLIFCQDLLLLLSRTKEKLPGETWSKKNRTTKKKKKKMVPLPRAVVPSWGAQVSGSHLTEQPSRCMFTSQRKKKSLHELLSICLV